MQQELRDAKRSLKDAVAEKDVYESKYNDVLETMEVTMLDKEMAEEKAENLQYEVDMLKEKVEEINVDLHVFQQEEGNWLHQHFIFSPRSIIPHLLVLSPSYHPNCSRAAS